MYLRVYRPTIAAITLSKNKSTVAIEVHRAALYGNKDNFFLEISKDGKPASPIPYFVCIQSTIFAGHQLTQTGQAEHQCYHIELKDGREEGVITDWLTER